MRMDNKTCATSHDGFTSPHPLESTTLEWRKRTIDTPDRSRPQTRKKPLISQGLKTGAGVRRVELPTLCLASMDGEKRPSDATPARSQANL